MNGLAVPPTTRAMATRAHEETRDVIRQRWIERSKLRKTHGGISAKAEMHDWNEERAIGDIDALAG